jgi:hypothetical protein
MDVISHSGDCLRADLAYMPIGPADVGIFV